jgi:hypothetical protein
MVELATSLLTVVVSGLEIPGCLTATVGTAIRGEIP